jgi:hypothetical protein
MYLSDKQKGIQTAHLLNAFWKKYSCLTSEISAFWDWIYGSETIIVLAGGNHVDLEIKWSQFSGYNYPYAAFREKKESLNGALTAVGIILPENFNSQEDRDERIRRGIGHNSTAELLCDAKLAELLNNSKLA